MEIALESCETQAVGEVGRGHVLTAAQEAMVLRSLAAPEAGHYIQQMVLSLPGPLREGDLRKAWESASRRHEALRVFFEMHEGEPLEQCIAQAIRCPLRIAGPMAGNADDQLGRLLEEDRGRGINLFEPPLWRLSVLQWASGDCTWIWTFHHALLDGRSHARVLREAVQLYLEPGCSSLSSAPPPASFPSFLDWLATRPCEDSRAYWSRRMEGFVSAPSLPSLALRQDAMAASGPHGLERTVFTMAETTQLRSTAERHGVTLNNLVQGAWALALGRYNEAHDVTFGVTRAGRHWDGRASTDAVGMFIQTVPFRVNVRPGQPVGEWLRGLRSQQLAVRGHEFVSAAEIRHWAGLPGGTPLWHSILVFEHHRKDEWGAFDEIPVLHERTDQLTLAAYAGQEVVLALEFSPAVHAPEQIRIVLAHLRSLLLSLAAAEPDIALADLSMMAPGERAEVLRLGRGPRVPFSDKPLLHLLEGKARQCADDVAVEFGETRLSYADLHGRANRLARRIREYALPGSRVCVLLDRSPEQIVALLALLKAGVAYVPLDPSSPPQRMEFLLRDLAPAAVLTQRDLCTRIPSGEFAVLPLDSPEEIADEAELSAQPLGIAPDRSCPACLFSTSGSTGQPKATMISFAGLDFLACTFASAFDLVPGDRVLQLSCTAFDFTLGEILPALLSGATLVMGRWAEIKPGPQLARFLEERHITFMLPAPSVLQATPVSILPALRLVLCGGEALSAGLVAKWGAGRRFVNGFGPSECTFWATYDECEPSSWEPTLGRPVENSRLYVLDADGALQPLGIPGELHIGGAGVGLGYWNRPELNAERFLPDPFSDAPGGRMYRSGDLVRWLADGRLEFLGRLDRQVKFRGIRLEPGEIEAVMEQHPQIRQAVVMVRGERLEAWLKADGSVPTPANLASWLAERLPLVLIPAEFHFLADLPRTGSGKTDRPKLLAMEPGIPDCWRGEKVSFPLDASVVDLFLAQARLQPDAIAVKEGDRLVSYREVERKARNVASALLRAGLHAEDPVAILLPRSAALASSLLGVLMAGGTYLPADPAIPSARLEYMLHNSGSRVVLTDDEGVERLRSGAVLAIDVDQLADGQQASPVAADSRRRAYIIYTSGSTGDPKGVEVEHHSLTNLVCHYRRRLALEPGHRATMLANVAFDASAADIWPTLCTGGQLLVAPPNALQDPDALIAWLVEEQATWTFVPTGLAEILFKRPWPAQVSLRFLLTGGDRLMVRPPPGFPVPVLNTYGPTENTVDSTWSEVAVEGAGSGRPPIGCPISNVNAYVLDERGRPVETGVEGELCLGGEQVARGYLGRPDLSAERFPPDPFSNRPDARMYRSGDRARWTPDGELEFLGRQDGQVQIRGNRVELGEIESILLALPSVRQVCCVPRVADGRATAIAAHVVPESGGDEQIPAWEAHLHARVAGYMVPSTFALHDRFPLTSAGKIDRQALQATETGAGNMGREVRARSSLESALHRLWSALLPTASTSSSDATFQELGGDSLTAVRLQLGVEEITGRRIEVSSLLLRATFAGLCHAVELGLAQMEFQPILALRKSGSRPPLFCLYSLNGDVDVYLELVEALGDEQPVYGIRCPALCDGNKAPGSIESAAREAVGWIRQAQPEGAPALIGHSLAGTLAFEISRQLAQTDGRAGFTGLVGAPSPMETIMRAARLAHFLATLPRWSMGLVADHRSLLGRLSRWRTMAAATKRLLVDKAVPHPMPAWISEALPQHLVRIGREYRPLPGAPVELDFFREKEGCPNGLPPPRPLDPWDHSWQPAAGWERWTQSAPRVHWVDGNHASVLKQPHVTGLASAIRKAMDQRRAEESRSAPLA